MLLITKQPQGTEQSRLIQKGSVHNRHKKAQAVSEFAIIGAIITVAFAAILSYGQMMNSQQSLQMRAFRRALQESRSVNRVVSYTIVRDNPAFVLNPFSRLDTRRQTASSTICGIRDDPLFPDPDDKDDRSSEEIYEINGQVRIIEPIKIKVRYDDGNDYETWMAAPIRDVAYLTQKQRTGTLSKAENASSISSTRTSTARADATTTLYLEDQAKFEREYLEDLKDNVAQEPWEKKMAVEDDVRRILEATETGVSLLAGALLKYIYQQIYGKWAWDKQCGLGGDLNFTTAMMVVGQKLLSLLFEYLLSNDYTDAEPASVEVIDGTYRSSDVKTATGSYSIPTSTFSVSH